MNPYNSSSESDSFSESSVFPSTPIILFKPEQGCSQIVSTFKLRRGLSRFQGLIQMWEDLINALAGRSEPKIYRKRDRQGNWYFRVYDPVMGRSVTLYSEQEMRTWIDQRYYL